MSTFKQRLSNWYLLNLSNIVTSSGGYVVTQNSNMQLSHYVCHLQTGMPTTTKVIETWQNFSKYLYTRYPGEQAFWKHAWVSLEAGDEHHTPHLHILVWEPSLASERKLTGAKLSQLMSKYFSGKLFRSSSIPIFSSEGDQHLWNHEGIRTCMRQARYCGPSFVPHPTDRIGSKKLPTLNRMLERVHTSNSLLGALELALANQKEGFFHGEVSGRYFKITNTVTVWGRRNRHLLEVYLDELTLRKKFLNLADPGFRCLFDPSGRLYIAWCRALGKKVVGEFHASMFDDSPYIFGTLFEHRGRKVMQKVREGLNAIDDQFFSGTYALNRRVSTSERVLWKRISKLGADMAVSDAVCLTNGELNGG